MIVAILGLAVVLLVALPWSYDVDSWLELLAGRTIWTHGLPSHETLTVMSYGKPWIDQQWLAQLAAYAVYRLGGLGLLGVVNVGLIVAGVALVVRTGWQRGVRLSVMLVMLLLGLWQIMPFREVRTQALAIPLIAAILILLSDDSRRGSRRVYWCLPVLVLLANIHGTASLCVGLVGVRALTMTWERRPQLRSSNPRVLAQTLARPVILGGGSLAALLLTPYGLQNLSYYRHTLGNSSLQHSVSEWQPITSHWGMAIVFFVLLGVTVWSFGRSPAATTSWEKISLLLLGLASIDVLRNDLLFGLAALLIVPASLNASVAPRRISSAPIRRRVNAALAGTAVAVATLATIATLGRPTAAFELKSQRPAVLRIVRAAAVADPSLRILADVRYADWLLWRDPGLTGKLANDARFEILTAQDNDRLQRVFGAVGPNWKAGARGYRLLVLDRLASPDCVRGFLAEPGRRILYEDQERIVILRSPAAAA